MEERTKFHVGLDVHKDSIGNLSSDKHYWIAAPFPGDSEDDIWISLPELLIDGTPARLPEIRFTRRFTIGRGMFNC